MILRKSVEGQPGDSGAILGKGTLGKDNFRLFIVGNVYLWNSRYQIQVLLNFCEK